ncbi:ATP-binding protein [Clostridium botulinum]|nr:ATP-binding protein [Clostridium botulinum]NFN20782.1 ATP-binding protein [Clostridium botulinum]NFN42000.1 ATP-binding protein [Clostridium botulinum]
MGIPVMILGESGSGKSTSMRNFDVKEVGIFNVASKPLPFKKKLNKINNAKYEHITNILKKPTLKKYVIDDSQYLMAFEMFDRAKEVGYNKFTDVALNFRNLIDFIVTKVPDDVIVYFLHHSEQNENGKIKAKTSGKMLDNQLTLEGLFSIVLLAHTDGANHKFITQSDGFTTCKSPMEMFLPEIDNDLKLVDNVIREYYEFESEMKKC